jgi:hypothetical protein
MMMNIGGREVAAICIETQIVPGNEKLWRE